MKNKIRGLSETKRAEVAEFIETLSEKLVSIYNVGYAAGYVDAKESAADDETILYHGLKLRKVNRVADIGDYIRVNGQKNGGLLKENTIHGPVEKDIDGQLVVGPVPFFVYEITVNRTHSTVEVFEVVVNEGVNCPTPIEKTPNQLRAELIQRAKAFVEKYQACRKGQDGIQNKKVGNSTARNHFYETDFFVKDGKTTAVVYWLVGGLKSRIEQSKHVGRSWCTPGGVFNEWIGKAIALARALQIDIPNEFLDAVQPSEMVVGMITGPKAGGYSWGTLKVAEIIDNGSELWDEEGSWIDTKSAVIIDDTNAIYEVPK